MVGYGPVGAAVACLLGKLGIRTLVIDRAPDILQMPRAIALDNEALRILQMAGLPGGAFQVRAIPRVRYLSPYAGEFARIHSCGSLDGHPKLVTFYQPELERVLRECVAGHSTVETATGIEMLGFSDHGDGVARNSSWRTARRPLSRRATSWPRMARVRRSVRPSARTSKAAPTRKNG